MSGASGARVTETRKLATILAVDIVGYSASAERDQTRAAEHVKALEQRLSDLASVHGGRIFSTAGDGFMLEFALASSAVRAALDLLDQGAAIGTGAPPVRMGAHLGEVIAKGADLLGHGVNVAARLMAAAEPNHLVISESLHAQLHGEIDASFELLGTVRLSKMRETIVAYSHPPQSGLRTGMRRLRAAAQRHWRIVSAVAALGASVIAAWYFTQPLRFELGALTSVAESRQPEIFPTLSPDGRFVIYTHTGDAGADLFMRPAEGGEATQLTNTADSHEISAAFSPDGSQLAFVRVRLPEEGPAPPCEIVVRPFPDGLERRVGGCESAADAFRLSWSPDAASLIFSEPTEGSMFGTVRVRRLSIETGETSDFIQPPPSGPGDFNAAFSPNGRHVAFVRYTARGVAQVCVFDTRTQRVTVIMDGIAWAHLDWIDDTHIIAATRRRDGQNNVELSTLGRDGARQSHLPTLAQLERLDYANGTLVFQVRSLVQNLRRFEGGNHVNVTDANVEDHDADFSSQGLLAYISGGAAEWIYIQQPGGPPRRLIETVDAYGLRWSSDGQQLVYSAVANSRRRLFITEVRSGVTRALDTPASEEPTNPAWGLDDRSLLYAGLSHRGARLYRLSLEAPAAPQPISDYGWVEAVETETGILARAVDREGLWRLTERGAPMPVCPELQRVGLLRHSERDWAVANQRIYLLETGADDRARVSYCPMAGGSARQIFEIDAMVSGSLAVEPQTGAVVYSEIVEQQADVAVAQLARTR